MSTFRVPRRTDQRRQVMTQWPAAIPEWGVFPSGTESGTTWVDEEDHTVATPTAAGPITAGATAIIYGSFSPPGGEDSASYSGTATASLIDRDGVVLQTLSITGGGAFAVSDEQHSQSAYISNVTTTGNRTVKANGQTITNVEDGAGVASFGDFIVAVTPGYRTEQMYKGSKCRVIPLTLAP